MTLAAQPMRSSTSFTVKALLRPLLRHRNASQLIKWVVYSALVLNFGVYAYDDWMAFRSSLGPDAPWQEILETFSTTVDTIAWLGLVFLFELETYALPEEKYTRRITLSMHAARLICYVSIAYATYGYTASTLDYYDVAIVPGLSSLCQVAGQGLAFQLDAIAYTDITAQNCARLSSESVFYKVDVNVSLIDWPTIQHARMLGWIDVANAFAWLFVVFLIEVEVRLQSADRYSGRLLAWTRRANTFFYAVLIANAVVWLATGYPMYAWDAFLWIFGFWAIELNLAEWEQDRVQELTTSTA